MTDEHDIAQKMGGKAVDILALPFEEFKPAIYEDLDRIRDGAGRMAERMQKLEQAVFGGTELIWQGLAFECQDVIAIFNEMMRVSQDPMIELTINVSIQNILAKKTE